MARRPKSLRRWLSRWLAVQTFVGLGIVCTVIYFATSLGLAARQDDELALEKQTLQHLIGEAQSRADMASVAHKLDDLRVGHPQLQIRITSANGQALYGSTAVERRAFPYTRLEKFTVSTRWSEDGPLQVEMVLDTSADAHLLRALAWALLACTFLGSMLVSLGGAWLVRRALRPVRQLTRQAAAQSSRPVGEPLDGSAQAEELQPLIRQFNALLERLGLAYRQLEGFNADVAHELRTPLATLIGQTELALKRKREASELVEVLESNLEDLNRMSGLINDMLFLSRADRYSSARRAPVQSLAALVETVLEYHEATLQESGLEVSVVGDAAGNFDTALLRRALSNLLSNATRYAVPDTTIKVFVQRSPPDVVCISVQNVGAPIAAEHLPRLFERFYRIDPARQQSQHNHGLGLSIVAAISHMHGGEPFAQHEQGLTTVGFTLSTADAPDASARVLRPHQPQPIEDDEQARAHVGNDRHPCRGAAGDGKQQKYCLDSKCEDDVLPQHGVRPA